MFFNLDYCFAKDNEFVELCYESLSELLPGEGPINLIRRSKFGRLF